MVFSVLYYPLKRCSVARFFTVGSDSISPVCSSLLVPIQSLQSVLHCWFRLNLSALICCRSSFNFSTLINCWLCFIFSPFLFFTVCSVKVLLLFTVGSGSIFPVSAAGHFRRPLCSQDSECPIVSRPSRGTG